jgi:predicted transcriptional regulator
VAKRVTVELPDELYAALAEIAKKTNSSLADALARAIATRKFVDDAKDGGDRLLVERAGDVQELDFK